MHYFLFRAGYWTISTLYVLLGLPLRLYPNRKPIMVWARLYTRTMCGWMGIVGIKLQVKGRDTLPEGPFLIAAKHQSWGDGIIMFTQFDDLCFVIGDHMLDFPLIGGILKKMESIMVNAYTRTTAQAFATSKAVLKAKAQGRNLLVYPEGHIAPVGTRKKYRKGIYSMYKIYKRPVVPVATNLGLRWSQDPAQFSAGPAIVEFLPPLPVGLDKETFMATLEERIENASLALLPDAQQKEHTPPITGVS